MNRADRNAYRKFTGWIGIVAVLFAQLAVSAYACPLQFQGLGEGAETVSVSEATIVSADFVSAGLCQKHRENAQQNVNDQPVPLAGLSLEPAFVVTLAPDAPVPLLVTALTPSLLHATSPPLSIRNCCFRI